MSDPRMEAVYNLQEWAQHVEDRWSIGLGTDIKRAQLDDLLEVLELAYDLAAETEYLRRELLANRANESEMAAGEESFRG